MEAERSVETTTPTCRVGVFFAAFFGMQDKEGRLNLGVAGPIELCNAFDRQQPLVGMLVDHQPRVTSTGANIGGTRPIS
jgi:hypothetical protein